MIAIAECFITDDQDIDVCSDDYDPSYYEETMYAAQDHAEELHAYQLYVWGD